MRSVVNRAQHVRRMPDVFERELLVERRDVEIRLLLRFLQRGVIVGAAGDRLLENRGIGSHTGKSVVLD